MDNSQNNDRDNFTIDLTHIFRTVCRKWWIILVAGILIASIGFAMSAFVIEPEYSASVRLYVNNAASSGSSGSISSSQIAAAQQLVDTYREILHSRPTYEEIIKQSSIQYTPAQLSRLIASGASNNTEVMYIEVTTHDPDEAALIANCIADVLPVRISQVIDGASVEIVEKAVPNYNKVSPSITKYTLVGGILGVILALAAIVVAELLDNTIHDENYMLQTYEFPMLAKIPNLLDEPNSKKYKYRYYRSSNRNKK